MYTKSKNINVRLNKGFDWYWLINYPDKCYKNYIKPIFSTLLHEPEPRYSLNQKYNIMLGKIGLGKQGENGVKLYDIKGQKLMIKLNPRRIPNNRLHYCNEKGVSTKKLCHGLNECIELEMTNKFKFSREINKSKLLNNNRLYALDIFDGDGSCNIVIITLYIV